MTLCAELSENTSPAAVLNRPRPIDCSSRCNVARHTNQSSPDDYLALSPLFITIELLITLGAEFNALSPHKLRETAGVSI